MKRHKLKWGVLVILGVAYYFCLPQTLFKDPTSTVITSREGKLLGAKIAADGQWRFPKSDSVPQKFKTCVLEFEDAYFYKHPGFNPVSIVKALKDNITQGEVKRGGSTITQQVIRLSRKGQSRTYVEKLIELILATRLELRCTKNEILSYYAGHAPFGGNVVGLDAASWRYFQRHPNDLSWAESATLAVLPNAPSLIYPGRNQQQLLNKRNALLKKLRDKKVIDTLTYTLAIAEDLPVKPYPLPQKAPHLLQKMALEHTGQHLTTSLDYGLQNQVNEVVKNHYSLLKQNEIHNAGVLVMNVHTRQVLSYVGNTPTDKNHQKDVDVIDKPRSTGSLLKPFLYAAMLDAGELLPKGLVADVPTQFGNYVPENFNKEFDGAVPANEALSRSLNVPSVRMLKEFGLDKFYRTLKTLHLKDLTYESSHYGLSLILGGSESNLWDLCKSYAALASTVNHFNETSSQYYSKEVCEPILLKSKTADFGKLQSTKKLFDAGSVYMTLESLKEVNRPAEDENWEFYDHSKQIAWKTGTSFGFRDAWAIGTTKDYVVGVWVGNADGEGRPGLVGIQAAAPLLFDVFDLLPSSSWFSKPYDELHEIDVCVASGFRASPNCEDVKKEWVPKAGLKTGPCPYHILVHLDQEESFQVNSSCESLDQIKTKAWFVLPPLMAHYYKQKNPFYKELPKPRGDCKSELTSNMAFIYPKEDHQVFLPKDFNGQTNELIVKITHSKPNMSVFWYLDNQYLGQTKDLHEWALTPSFGTHTITAVDEMGQEISRDIEISK